MGENSTIGGTRNWADAIDVTQWGNAPETLRALIGACVTVLLTNGSTHAGVLYTADPATGTVMLLEADPDKRSASGTTTLNSLRCRVFLGHSVQGIQARPPPVALQSLDNHSDAVMSSDIPTEMHLFQSHRVMQFAETMLGAKEDSKNHDGQFEDNALMLAKRDTVVQLLQAQRIPVAVDGVNLDLLQGVAHIAPPYGPENCQSMNSIVLQRLQRLLQTEST